MKAERLEMTYRIRSGILHHYKATVKHTCAEMKAESADAAAAVRGVAPPRIAVADGEPPAGGTESAATVSGGGGPAPATPPAALR